MESRSWRPTVLPSMGRLALLGACVLCLCPVLRAQETDLQASPRPIQDSAARIAREYWPTDIATFTIDEQGRPRFRSGVTATLPSPPWQPSSEPEPDRYRGAISHQEMLRVMTPQQFSTPLVSASVDPGEIYNSIKKAWRESQARRIHERVMKEIEELERLNAAADTDR
jgi:hypothetical protein